jgi:glycosyltransferase involved in cell wall biosynthesis
MRIILIGYLHNHGGIQNHTHWLAKGLAARGHEVDVLTPAQTRGAAAGLPTDTPYAISEYRGLADLLRFALNRWSGIDAVAIAGTGWKAMALALAIRPVGKRIFFEVMRGQRFDRLDPRSMVHLGFDAIVGQGRDVERVFCRDFRWNKPSVVIPALPEPLDHLCDIRPGRRLPQSPNRKLRLAHFSRLVPHKGAGYLVDNWQHLARHADSLDIWGQGPAHDDLAAKISTAGLADKIALRGRYPRGGDYVTLLQSYDMTLLPTWGNEGAPLVLLESMACGVPFVANGVGGIPDYANPQCEVTSGDLAEFLPLYDRLAERIRSQGFDAASLQAYYRANFGYERLVDRWESFFASPLPEAKDKCAL